jgi:hypothetical protein
MSILNSPHEYDDKFMEATVTSVDPIRFVCTVKTVRGQYFSEVAWLLPSGGSGKSGMHVSPTVGDQVVISTVLTYPVIFGFLPRLGTPRTSLTNVTGQDFPLDAGNGTNMKNGYVTNPDKPSDYAPGDMVITTEGGGILALLVNGTAMLKASPLASIFLSKYDDLVRVVARNWYRFSDVGQQTAANVKGRLYEFMGWDRSLDRSKVDLYELKEVIGDVAAGEVLLGDPNSDVALPVADSRVRKYWLQDTAGHDLMVEVLTEDGKLVITTQDVAATSKNIVEKAVGKQEMTVLTPTSSSKITIVPGSVTVLQSGGATTVHDAAGVRSSFSGHFVNIDSSGVHMG